MQPCAARAEHGPHDTQVEGHLADTYQRAKVAAARSFLRRWLGAEGLRLGGQPLPAGLRDVALEFVNSLVSALTRQGLAATCRAHDARPAKASLASAGRGPNAAQRSRMRRREHRRRKDAEVLGRWQVEMASELQEGAPSQFAPVLGRLLAGLLAEAGDLLLDSLEGACACHAGHMPEVLVCAACRARAWQQLG